MLVAILPDNDTMFVAWDHQSQHQISLMAFSLKCGDTPLWTYTMPEGRGSFIDFVADLKVSPDGAWIALGSWGSEANSHPEFTLLHASDPTKPAFVLDTPGSGQRSRYGARRVADRWGNEGRARQRHFERWRRVRGGDRLGRSAVSEIKDLPHSVGGEFRRRNRHELSGVNDVKSAAPLGGGAERTTGGARGRGGSRHGDQIHRGSEVTGDAPSAELTDERVRNVAQCVQARQTPAASDPRQLLETQRIQI